MKSGPSQKHQNGRPTKQKAKICKQTMQHITEHVN